PAGARPVHACFRWRPAHHDAGNRDIRLPRRVADAPQLGGAAAPTDRPWWWKAVARSLLAHSLGSGEAGRSGGTMERSQLFDRAGKGALAGYFAIWAIALGYLALRGADWTFPIASLVIF